jgi:hypothetical protein
VGIFIFGSSFNNFRMCFFSFFVFLGGMGF